jgi:anti-sigma-K factor RskA
MQLSSEGTVEMSSQHDSDRSRLELLAGKVLGDLSDEERFEVSQMLQDEAFREELNALERTAAVMQIAALSEEQELPEVLRARLQNEARQYQVVHPSRKSAAGLTWRESLAWVGCAAALLLCLSLWNRDGGLQGPVEAPSAVLARAELLQQATDVVQVAWADGTSPFNEPVIGDVVWSNTAQSGFMLFAGMPINVPTVEQYQLWIIDPGRDDEPIDGGVFDIGSAGEVVIPIRAKLGVVSPKAFAITIEKPGGVVVSTQARLPLLASIQ